MPIAMVLKTPQDKQCFESTSAWKKKQLWPKKKKKTQKTMYLKSTLDTNKQLTKPGTPGCKGA